MSIDLQSWVGRYEDRTDMVSPAPIKGLMALLDQDDPPQPSRLAPPLAHWLHFLPDARQSMIGVDGHPKHGAFLPPIPFPRRMWAGSRISFHAPLIIGEAIRRRTTIAAITPKRGRQGEMLLLTLHHVIRNGDGRIAIEEDQDLVFRAPPSPGDAVMPPPLAENGENVRGLMPDSVMLFRYSALTFNSHRIHYDRDYARQQEGYPDLVVQGPLLATLLMDHFRRTRQDANVQSFSFRAQGPVFVDRPLCLHSNIGQLSAELWVSNEAERLTMSATIGFR